MLDLAKDSNAFLLMQDLFKLMKANADLTIDDTEKWEKLLREGNALVDKYKGDIQTKRLALEMIFGYIKFWEGECRNEPV